MEKTYSYNSLLRYERENVPYDVVYDTLGELISTGFTPEVIMPCEVENIIQHALCNVAFAVIDSEEDYHEFICTCACDILSRRFRREDWREFYYMTAS